MFPVTFALTFPLFLFSLLPSSRSSPKKKKKKKKNFEQQNQFFSLFFPLPFQQVIIF